MRQLLRPVLVPIVGGLVFLVALLGLIGTAIRDPHPHDLAVGLVGPAPAVQQMSSAFAGNAPGAFRFTTYSSESEARAAIDSRDIDAALLFGQSSSRLIVAGAAGGGGSGVVTGAFTNVFHGPGSDLTVEAVAPVSNGEAQRLVLFFVVVSVSISEVVV